MKFENVCRKNLLTAARAYKRATGLSMATISRKFHGTDDFLTRFAAGQCSVRLDTYGQMIRKLAKAWPVDAPKPDLEWVPPT